MRRRDPRIVRIERELRLERDAARSYLESVEVAWRAAHRALVAHAGGRGGGRPISREEHAEGEAALAESIAGALADGAARTPDAIVAALAEDGIEVERAEVNGLLHAEATRPGGRFERAGAGYKLKSPSDPGRPKEGTFPR